MPTRTGIEPTQAAIESIIKYQELHRDKKDAPEQRSKFIYNYQKKLIERLSIAKSQSLECQIMDMADDIGNALIDFTDGVRSGIITQEALNDQKNAGNLDKSIKDKLPRNLKSDSIDKFATWRIGECVKSLQVETSTPAERKGWKVSLDEEHWEFIKALRGIISQLLFKNSEIQANDNSGSFMIRVMFEAFVDHYCEKTSDSLFEERIIPPDWHQRMVNTEKAGRCRLVADFISGMTDDYAKIIYDKVIETGLTR